jgi:hypothetical protein
VRKKEIVMDVSDRYVSLRGGLVVPVTPVLLLLDLESRGFQISRDGDDMVINPFQRLTAEDIRSLKLWKRHVLALLDYEPTEGAQ